MASNYDLITGTVVRQPLELPAFLPPIADFFVTMAGEAEGQTPDF